MHCGLTLTKFDINALTDKSDRKVFRQDTQPGHSLHHLLPPSPKTSTYSSYQLCTRQHSYLLLTVLYLQFKNVISIIIYLTMYNLPLVASRCVSLVFS